MGLPLVGEEGVGHLTLGNPRGVETGRKGTSETSQCLAAQLLIPSAEEQRLVIFTTWAKKCSEEVAGGTKPRVQLGVCKSNPTENALRSA